MMSSRQARIGARTFLYISTAAMGIEGEATYFVGDGFSLYVRND